MLAQTQRVVDEIAQRNGQGDGQEVGYNLEEDGRQPEVGYRTAPPPRRRRRGRGVTSGADTWLECFRDFA